MRSVLFLTEAGKSIGFGHINRCLALAEGFKRFDYDVDLIIRGSIDDSIIHECGNTTLFEWLNFPFLKHIIVKYSVVVIDSYYAKKDILKHIAKYAKLPVFLIDSTMNFYPKGIVLFPSVYANKFNFLNNKEFELIAGKDYLLFNSFMHNAPKCIVKNKVNKIGISLGGYHQRGIIEQICESINLVFSNVTIKIFGLGDIIEIDSVKILNLGLLKKKNYLEEIQDLDIIFVNGGQSLNECLFVNIPTISLVMADNQLLNSMTWSKLGACKTLNPFDKNFENDVLEALRLYKNPMYRKGLSLNCGDLLKPNGSMLAVKEILKIKLT